MTSIVKVIIKTGEAIYGPSWRRPFSKHIGIHEKTLRRWLAGEYHPPADIIVRCISLLSERIDVLKSVRVDICEVTRPESRSEKDRPKVRLGRADMAAARQGG